MKGKHAYLIIAHKDDFTFRTLIQLLDYEDNDIFIHMDRKLENYNPGDIIGLCKYSNVYHTKRTSVSWGGYSQINAELILLEKSILKEKYMYYHLLSGQDMPIKSQQEIHKFFEKNAGKEFVRFQSEEFTYDKRVRWIHLFNEFHDRNSENWLWNLSKRFVGWQQRLGFSVNKNIAFKKGTNWFSITDSLARYVVSQKKQIKKIYRYSFCADEIFLQTLIYNSSFKEQLANKNYDGDWHSNMRLIDWSREGLLFKKEDFKDIISSDYLFARKFDYEFDSEIIKLIVWYLEVHKVSDTRNSK